MLCVRENNLTYCSKLIVKAEVAMKKTEVLLVTDILTAIVAVIMRVSVTYSIFISYFSQVRMCRCDHVLHKSMVRASWWLSESFDLDSSGV